MKVYGLGFRPYGLGSKNYCCLDNLICKVLMVMQAFSHQPYCALKASKVAISPSLEVPQAGCSVYRGLVFRV